MQTPALEILRLTQADEKKGVQVRLAPLAAVSGRVRDKDGFPVRDAQISVLTYQYTMGGRTLVKTASASANDLGEYRVFDIPHGKYILFASPGKGSAADTAAGEAYRPTYYPGTLDPASAALIEIQPGQQVTNMDVLLPRDRAVSIRGTLLRPLGSTFAAVSLTQRAAELQAVLLGSAIRNEAGAFEIRGVAAGKYTLEAQATVDDKMYRASLPVVVGMADVEGLELRPAAPAEVHGTVKIEGESKIPLTTTFLSLRGQNGAFARTSGVREDGSFVAQGVQPGTYRAMITAPGNLYLKSFRCGDHELEDLTMDLTDIINPCPLSLVFSANGAQIWGTVMLDAGVTLSPNARVTLTSTDSKRPDAVFRFGSIYAKGRFLITGVAPGAYRLVAWDDVDLNAARYDPDFLKGYESAGQSIRIYEGIKPEEVTLTSLTKRRPE